MQVFVLFGIFLEGDVRQFFDVSIGNRHVETIAEVVNPFHVHFLHLVSDVFTFRGFTHAVTFDGVGQDNGRFAFGVLRFFQCSEDFLRIVTTTVQRPDFVVGHVFDQRRGFRVTAEEVLAHVSAVFGFEGLVVAVQGLVHQLNQFTAGVFAQQLVPTAAPDHFQHLPACAGEDAFQFVDDLAVTGDRAVQALQVTVDDEHQVVQLLAGGDGDGAFGFRLIHLAVAQEGVNGLLRGVFQAAVFQVFQELRLIDGADWAQAHGYGRELPEFRHQLRMRIRGQAVAVHFLTEVVHLFFGQAAFKEGARVNARRDVALEVDQVAAVFLVACAEEVVKADFIEGRGRLEGSHVAAQLQVFLGCAQNGHDRVPTDRRANAAFQIQVAWVSRFVFYRDGVDVVVRRSTGRNVNAAFAGFSQYLINQKLSSLNTLFTDDRFDRLQPVAGFDRIHVIV